MWKQSPSKNQKSKGVKVRRVLQICLLVGIFFWLIYQVKHFGDKRNEIDERDARISVKEQSGEVLQLGRKGLRPRIDEGTKNGILLEEGEEVDEKEENKHDEEGEGKENGHEVEERDNENKLRVEERDEENKHDEEGEEKENGHEVEERDNENKHGKEKREEENKHDEEGEGKENGNAVEERDNENKHGVEEREQEKKHESEEQEKEEDENEDDQEEEGDWTKETEWVGGEANEIDEKALGNDYSMENFMDEQQEREEKNKGNEGGVENKNSLDDQDGEGGNRDSHGARANHYKADDASSGMAHDTHTISPDPEKQSSENSNVNPVTNVIKQETNYNSAEEVTGNPNNLPGHLQKGTGISDSTQAQNAIVGSITAEDSNLQTGGLEQASNSTTTAASNQPDYSSTISTKTENADGTAGDRLNVSSYSERWVSETDTSSGSISEAEDGFGSLKRLWNR